VVGGDGVTWRGPSRRGRGGGSLAGDCAAGWGGARRGGAVVTAGGRRPRCASGVVGVAITADVAAVEGSSISLSNGILADELCRTSAPDVYAAGDVVNHLHPLFGRIRVEHFNNAEKQGAAAARSMLGSVAPYDYVHSFWSDQYDHKIEYVGHAEKWDEFVARGSVSEGKLVGF